MTKLIESKTRLEAWSTATSLLLESDEESLKDIILSITDPGTEHELTEFTFGALNENYSKADEYPIHAIAEWICPYDLYLKEGIEGVYETYPERMETFDPVRNWGPYAMRLVERFDPDTGENYNPLKRLIQKMDKARNEAEFPRYKSCYELGFLSGPFDIPLYDPANDRKRYRGGPCLSHVSFKLIDDTVHLTAFYRNHDYHFKVPGNLLGLARLQKCVAQEIGTDIGELVIHSSRAYIKSGEIRDFRGIVQEVESQLK